MQTKLMMLKVDVEEVKMSDSDTAVSVTVTWSHPYTPAGRNRGLQQSCFALAVPEMECGLPERSAGYIMGSVAGPLCSTCGVSTFLHRRDGGEISGTVVGCFPVSRTHHQLRKGCFPMAQHIKHF